MSDKLTRIYTPREATPTNSLRIGIGDWGEKTCAEMIRQMRDHAKHLRAQADAIDATQDDEFEIEVIRGPHVQKHVKTLQPGKARLSDAGTPAASSNRGGE